MAITIIKEPAEIHSGYNPIKYTISSSNRNKLGFRYVVEIYDKGTQNLLAEYRVAPDVDDNNLGKIDVSRIIQNKLTGYFTTTVTPSNQIAIGAYYNYDIKFGESMPYEWEFDDYIFLPGSYIGLTTDSQYGSGFSDETHQFEEGDQISIKNNANYSDNRRLLNGIHTVVDVINNKTIRIAGDYNTLGSNPYSGGKANFADGKKVIDKADNVVTKMAVNTALNYKEYVSSQGSLSKYIPINSDSKILTNQPKVYRVTPDQLVYFNVLNNDSTQIRIRFENDSGEVFSKSLTFSRPVWAQSVGPDTDPTNVVTGVYPLIKPDTKWYKVYLYDPNNEEVISEEYKFILDNRCRMNDAQVMFRDRKGSYNTFAFQLRKQENVRTKKESYDKYNDDYDISDRGTTVYHSQAEKTLSLTTNFMSEAMNMYYQEMMTSKDTYVLYKGDWYACIITDTSFENEFERNNKLINKTASVKFAMKDPIN